MARRDDDLPLVRAVDAAELRAWFEAHHDTVPAMWLVLVKKGSDEPSVTYAQAVEEALCFGWIDATIRPIDDHHRAQYFAPRRPTSVWARSNKERVERLIAEGRMRPEGMAIIEVAKANGRWTLLDDAEALVVADDLATALDATPGARAGWDRWTDSVRKACLGQLAMAKRPETRAKRIAEVLAAIAEDRKPFSL